MRTLKNYLIPKMLPEELNKLLTLHNDVMKKILSDEKSRSDSNLTVYEIKRKLFKAYLKECCLCGHKCGGERIDKGECAMGNTSYYHQHFVHIGEEKEIGRTLVIELIGCNIRCRFCQKGELINPHEVKGISFTPSLWEEIRKEYPPGEFDNISFLGGNPDQSFLAILNFLRNAPSWASYLPIIWHTNGYSTPAFYNLLWGLVDILVFDFKYFNNNCAFTLSQAPQYKETATSALKTICEKKLFNLVIVRHLVLPGHWDCCQRPLVEHLRGLKSAIIFHPMAQYKPAWKITEKGGKLSLPLENSEFRQVEDYALNAGLTLTF
ncbi:MAG: radical SAM protein [bacterium]